VASLEQRRWSCLSGALGQVAEIESENTFFVVSSAGPRKGWGDGTVGDSEKDVASHDRNSDQNRRGNRIRLV